MPNKLLRKKQFEDVINALWQKSKEKFVSNVRYEPTDRSLKQTKSGQETDIVTGLVTRWADLDHVEEYTHINILDYSKVIPNKAIDGYGEHINASADWGTIEFPVTANEDYTLLRQRNANVKIRFVDNNGTKVGFVDSPAPSSNSWHRCKFTAPLGATKGILEVKITQHNEYKTMIFLGDQLGLSVDTNKPIPFADNKYIQIGKEVSLGFDNSNSNIKSKTVETAIKEINEKIGTSTAGVSDIIYDGDKILTITKNGQQSQINLTPLVGIKTINGQPGNDGAIDLSVNNTTDNIEFKVGGFTYHTLNYMTDQDADTIIAGFTL